MPNPDDSEERDAITEFRVLRNLKCLCNSTCCKNIQIGLPMPLFVLSYLYAYETKFDIMENTFVSDPIADEQFHNKFDTSTLPETHSRLMDNDTSTCRTVNYYSLNFTELYRVKAVSI